MHAPRTERCRPAVRGARPRPGWPATAAGALAAGLAILSGCVAAAPAATPRDDLGRTAAEVLDDLHRAAAEADGPRYLGHFAPDAVFMGTDATERWTLDEFAAYVREHFAGGTGWTWVPLERHVAHGAGGRVAWFDERLAHARYGEARGTGVLVRVQGRWRVAHYNLAFPIPNEIAEEVTERIRSLAGG